MSEHPLRKLRLGVDGMGRETRNALGTAIAAFCPASFVTYLYLFFTYLNSRPREPNLDFGLVYTLDNHGSRVYISPTESTGLALLALTFAAAFFLTIAIIPKEPILPSPETSRWLTFVSSRFETDLGNPSRRLKVIFFGALACYVAIISLAGRWLVDFLVCHSVVLHFG